MALVNPQIAMSYRPTVEYQPRNALAEYAQIQSIVGGQRQAEMADMQMEALRRERDALGQIQAAIVAKGGPPDLEAAADAMIKTGRPEYLTQGMAIRTALRNQREAEAYRREYGGGATPANALVAPAAAAAPASQGDTVTARDIPPVGGAGAPAPLTQGAAPVAKKPLMQMSPEELTQYFAARRQDSDERAREIDRAEIARIRQDIDELPDVFDNKGRFSFEARSEIGRRRIEDLLARRYNREGVAPISTEPVVVAPFAPTAAAASANTLAPVAAPVANAMLASAAVPAAAVPDANAIRLRALEAQYRRIGNNPELASEKALLLKQIEAALRGDQNRPMAVSRGQVVIDPRTGQQIFSAPETTTLSDRFVPVGNLVFDRQTQQYITPTEAQLTLTRPQQARAPVAVLQNGRPVYVSPEQAVGQTPFTPASVQVLGMGPGREPPAPTITQIQDPTDPTRMITIDARRYQGGGVGTPGVIGASGKTPAATAAAMKKEEGATQAKDILDTLRTAYDTLDQARAVPSQQRNALSNALSYVAGTGVGQVAGRVVGTEAQTQRDIIASARNQMLNAIKNATGMSAQQLNSNVEFRSWLEALTDPTRSIEANRAILDNMEKFIASGGKYSAKGGSQAAPAAAPAGGATGGNLSPAEQAELDQLRARFGKK
jgi:hypothetical protein